jgi:cysteine dioxygenase
MMAAQLSIDAWIGRLQAIPRKEFALARIDEFQRAHSIEAETLQPYLFYAKSHYTRNLIFKNELFEVMAICWDSGQVSRIHNHRGQNCWMSVPIGRLRVQNFRVEERDAGHGTCRIIPTDFYDMHPENPGTVQPETPVHQVLNLPEFDARATSVHIYSYPYSSCEIYSQEEGAYNDVPLFYSSEYGRLSPDEKLL